MAENQNDNNKKQNITEKGLLYSIIEEIQNNSNAENINQKIKQLKKLHKIMISRLYLLTILPIVIVVILVCIFFTFFYTIPHYNQRKIMHTQTIEFNSRIENQNKESNELIKLEDNLQQSIIKQQKDLIFNNLDNNNIQSNTLDNPSTNKNETIIHE